MLCAAVLAPALDILPANYCLFVDITRPFLLLTLFPVTPRQTANLGFLFTSPLLAPLAVSSGLDFFLFHCGPDVRLSKCSPIVEHQNGQECINLNNILFFTRGY